MIRRLAAVLALMSALSACSGSGHPTGFDQQPVPLSEELLAALGTAGRPCPNDPSEQCLPVIERNFLEGCVLAERSRVGDVSDLAASCQCAYDEIVSFYRDNTSGESPEAAEEAALDQFEEVNDALASGEGVIPADVQALIDGCAT